MIKYNCFGVSIIYIFRFKNKITYLVKLNNMRMTNEFENVNLSGHSLNIAHILNFLLLKYLYCIFLACEVVVTELDLSKGTFSNSLA